MFSAVSFFVFFSCVALSFFYVLSIVLFLLFFAVGFILVIVCYVVVAFCVLFCFHVEFLCLFFCVCPPVSRATVGSLGSPASNISSISQHCTIYMEHVKKDERLESSRWKNNHVL